MTLGWETPQHCTMLQVCVDQNTFILQGADYQATDDHLPADPPKLQGALPHAADCCQAC